MIWIHGGGWTLGDKAPVQKKPSGFVEKGFVFVSINYRLFPKVKYKAQARDVAKSIRWLHDHADEYGGDPNQIYIMGHSSGAHLAALTATDKAYLKSEDLPLTTIKGVILLDGAGYDIPKDMETQQGPRIRLLYQGVFGTDEAGWKEASPITHVGQDKGIAPFLVFHAGDRQETRLQSERLVNVLKGAGVSARLIHADQKTHATINQQLGQREDEPTRRVFEFVDSIRAKTGRQ
jgi:acetyl esterase/lipase